MAAPKSTTAKKPAAKKITTATSKVTAKTATTKTAATAKKPAPAKTAAPVVEKKAAKAAKAAPAPTPEQRYKMVQEAAYFIAERNGFASGSMDYWIAAEAEIEALLSGKK